MWCCGHTLLANATLLLSPTWPVHCPEVPYMVDLNVLSKVGGFKQYLEIDTAGVKSTL